jgi:hypothetical protein
MRVMIDTADPNVVTAGRVRDLLEADDLYVMSVDVNGEEEEAPSAPGIPEANTFAVVVRVTVEPGNSGDGGYDGDPDPNAVRAWLVPFLARHVNDHAPYGITAEPAGQSKVHFVPDRVEQS